MDGMYALLTRMTAPLRWRDDRGDVPGWVMITVMSAALVVAILAVAETGLTGLLRRAFDSVGG